MAGMTKRTLSAICALVALALISASCSFGDTGEAELATEDARSGIAALTQDTTEFVELGNCPFDPSGTLLLQSVADVDSPDVSVAVVAPSTSATDVIENDVGVINPFVACDRAGDTGESFGLVVAEPPGDFDRYLDVLTDAEGDPDRYTIERSESSEHRGGTFESLCVNDVSEPEFSWCEVNWIDENLHVTLYIGGPATRPSDLDSMQAGLAGVLDQVVANLV